MDIKDIFAPIVADMREKSAEGEVRKLRKALESLANEVSGAWEMAEGELRHLIGNTNYAVVQTRIAEARRVLEETA